MQEREVHIKAVFFDIDGTILDCSGAGKKSLIKATLEVFGTIGNMKMVDFQGKTDPVILIESLHNMGFSEQSIAEKSGALKEKYFSYLEKFILEHDSRIMPGVMEIIESLAGNDRVLLGVLTGNFRESARIKLDRFNLSAFFKIGVYGDDAPVRNGLPPVARGLIRDTLGLDIDYGDMTIIGDTVYDIDCAKNVGAVSIAVGTGWADRERLLARGPDHYFEDLRDTGRVLDIILS
ncbi:MAG: HAD hydrolase-like protein [Spirochaetes bacterium]|jgi:phosphoglycolate phosphatase-like HAD superfamily hydrolase|nr:HAD hydrolase-like protein [Spirochaetota bacterium]